MLKLGDERQFHYLIKPWYENEYIDTSSQIIYGKPDILKNNQFTATAFRYKLAWKGYELKNQQGGI